MSELPTVEQLIVATGCSREAAERMLARKREQLAAAGGIRVVSSNGVPRDAVALVNPDGTGVVVRGPAHAVPALVWPVRMVIPWSLLVSDNDRFSSAERKGGGLLLTSAYRQAKKAIRGRAIAQLGADVAVAEPLALAARVWVPNDTRVHDVCNFAKCVHDALETVVYTNDGWLYSTHWMRAGTNVDAPRCELTITPCPLNPDRA